MKILVPSPVTPDKNSVRIVYVSEIMKQVKKKIDLDFFGSFTNLIELIPPHIKILRFWTSMILIMH